jgi:cation:H+ antiporter
MIPSLILIIVFFSFVLIKAADMVIVATRRLSRETHTKVFVLSAVILALGTSFPEFFVGLTAALEKSPNLSLGDVTGSNIANIALIGGLAAFFVGRVNVRGEYIKREVGIALVAGMLPLILLIDGSLSRVDGLILLASYFAYATSFFRERFIQIGEEQREESFIYRFLRQFNHINARKKREMGRLFVGVALLLFSADVIVKSAVFLASLAHIPEFVVGVIIVAIGTSLPELAFSIRSLEDHEPQMFFGNLLGSTIANSTLVIGTVAIIYPIQLAAANKYYVASAVFLIVFLGFWIFIRTKHRLDRWEALLLLMMYLVFVIVEFIG